MNFNKDIVKKIDPELNVVVSDDDDKILYFVFESGKFKGIAFRISDFSLNYVDEDNNIEANYGLHFLNENSDQIDENTRNEIHEKVQKLIIVAVEQIMDDITLEYK